MVQSFIMTLYKQYSFDNTSDLTASHLDEKNFFGKSNFASHPTPRRIRLYDFRKPFASTTGNSRVSEPSLILLYTNQMYLRVRLLVPLIVRVNFLSSITVYFVTNFSLIIIIGFSVSDFLMMLFTRKLCCLYCHRFVNLHLTSSDRSYKIK
jgi:hypothetical protein